MVTVPTTSEALAGDAVVRERDQLRGENDALRRERDELRRLLGMDPQLQDAHRTSVRRTLLDSAVADHFAGVDMRSPGLQKVALYRSLFRGRDDVFARRWSNERTGRSGYSPAVRDGWRSGGRNDAPLLPLTDDVVEQHLRGALVAGVYSMLQDGSCWFVACDFDGETWALDALAYLRACAAASVPAALERSRSGRGGHVWTFFSEPAPAPSARRVAMQLLRAAMDERCELDLASYDRLFPSQDTMPKGGYGNLIALPLQPAARRQHNSEFLDPTTLAPWPDQWAFLAHVSRLSRGEIEERIEYLPPLDVGPDARLRRPRRRADEPQLQSA